MIETRALTFRYGDFTAVNALSFKARSGEIIALLGPNGAGKTTTMRMLTGYLPPTSGTALIDGKDIVSDSMAARRRIGYMPERVPAYPDMTAREFLLFWGRMRGLKHPADSTTKVLKQFDLYSRRNKLIRQFSKGQRQRLGLAQALLHDPPVVILDEPTIGIDPQQVIEVREAVRALGKDRTVIFSTHLLKEAEAMCDRVIILNRGQLVAQGTPDQLQQSLGHPRYFVQFSGGDAADQRALLTGLAFVRDVEADGDGWIVTCERSGDARLVLSRALTGAGRDIIELRPLRDSLETIFLEAVAQPEGKPQS